MVLKDAETDEGGVIDKNNATESRKMIARNKKLVKEWGKMGVDQSAILTPKIDDDNWAVIDNAIFGSPMLTPFSCSNTINSHCMPYSKIAANVDECKEICKQSDNCDFGEFVTIKGKNYCFPFSSLWLNSNTGADNMINNAIWNLDSNYQNKHIESSVFLNYNLYSPFTKFNYSIFYGDKLIIRPIDYETKKPMSVNLGTEDENEKAVFLDLTTLLQLISPSQPNEGIVGVANWANLTINIYGTYLVLQSIDCKKFTKYEDCEGKDSDKNFVIWYDGLGAMQGSTSSATIICFEKDQGEILTYDDEVVFIMGYQYICTDGKNIFLRNADDINKYNTDDSNESKLSYKFKIIPKFDVSYCNNSARIDITNKDENIDSNDSWGHKQFCKMITIDQCKRIDDNFYYIDEEKKQHRIYRGTWCMGRCRDDQSVKATNQVPFKTPSYKKHIIIDQLIISISITVISFILFIILKS